MLSQGITKYLSKNPTSLITAICTKYGLYEFSSMPMGLTNSTATFQRLMELAFRGLQWHTCLIYLDDVVVFGKTFDEHLHRVQEVLERIRAAQLKLKPKNVSCFKMRSIFLDILRVQMELNQTRIYGKS